MTQFVQLIFEYIFPGSLFLMSFCFITSNSISTGIILASSICITHVVKSALLAFKLTSYLGFVGTISQSIACLVLGYIFGIIVTRKWFNRFLIQIGISRQTGANFWADLIEKDLWMMIYDENCVHYGVILLVDDSGDSNYVVLGSYQKMDMSGNILTDESSDKTVRKMFDLSKYKEFKLITRDK